MSAPAAALLALEENTQLTALFLWTYQSTATNGTDDFEAKIAGDPDEQAPMMMKRPNARPAKGLTLIFDVVRRFSQPLGIHLDAWENRIVETKRVLSGCWC